MKKNGGMKIIKKRKNKNKEYREMHCLAHRYINYVCMLHHFDIMYIVFDVVDIDIDVTYIGIDGLEIVYHYYH